QRILMKQAPQYESRQSFYEDVYEVVRLIPKGRATSYGAIARYLGAAKSARMVGYAMNQSFQLPDFPAHRVVNRNGLLSGRHHFPPERPMAESLQAEGMLVEDDHIQNFSEVFWDPNVELAL
ncbi:MAG: MGMT family protein, partial [Bacteroidota bacterium]